MRKRSTMAIWKRIPVHSKIFQSFGNDSFRELIESLKNWYVQILIKINQITRLMSQRVVSRYIPQNVRHERRNQRNTWIFFANKIIDLKRFPIHWLSHEGCEIYIFNSSHIHGTSRVSLMFTFSETLYATHWAKSMPNSVCIESVFGHDVISGEEFHRTRWHERKQKSFSLTVWTIALENRLSEVEFDLVFYCATVATSDIMCHKML